MSIADTHGYRYDDDEPDERLPFEEDAVRDHLDACIRLWRERRDEAEANPGASEEDVALTEHYVDAYQSMRTSIFGEVLPPDVEVVQRVMDILVYRNGAKVVEQHNVLIDNLSQEVEVPWYDSNGATYVVRATIKP